MCHKKGFLLMESIILFFIAVMITTLLSMLIITTTKFSMKNINFDNMERELHEIYQ